MAVVFLQILQFFLLIAVGYLLGKTVLKDKDQSRLLSVLLIYVFLPANVFKTFANNFTVETIGNNADTLLISLAVLLVIIVGSHYTAKLFSREKYEQKVYEYSLIVPNCGYMGYSVMEALYGEIALMNMMIFAIPMTVYIYTVGYMMLTKSKFSLKKLVNPTIIALLLGIIFGICKLPLPSPITGVLNRASACMMPISMLLIGITLSGFGVLKLFQNYRIYILAGIRLLFIPIAVILILKPFVSYDILLSATVLYAMPCGANSVVFPRFVGENCESGASILLVSNILACFTIPLCLILI